MLALVDAVQSNPATLGDAARTLLAENQDYGVESSDCHVRVASLRVGTCSAAPVAQNEKSLNSAMPAAGVAIAEQTQEQVEQGYSASLSGENQVSSVEIKAVDEGESSAAPVPNPEKWSHKAIVARSNVRPVRREKLNRAANSGQNPGFDFLLSCWNDDPAKADCDQEPIGEVSAVGNCNCGWGAG